MFLIFSCNKNQKDAERALLSQYLEENNIIKDPVADGLYIIENGFSTSESSDFPQKGDTLIIIYKGYLLSDQNIVFDEKTIDNPGKYVYLTDKVIPGWEKAVGLMKKNMPALLIMSSDWAYKGHQTGIIPPYSTLIFEVRIVEIIKP